MIFTSIFVYILVYRHDHTVPYISMVGFLHDLSSLSTEAWHLSQLMLLFMTQAAMELESRGLLALLLLSLLLGSASKDGKVMEADGSRCFSGCGAPLFPCLEQILPCRSM